MKDLEERLIRRMKEYFGDDERRIKHALQVTAFAKQIMEGESGSDETVVIPAAILHDIGIPESERKYGSNAGKYQEIEGPPIAREIMSEESVPPDVIEEVCEIIGNHHSPGKINTLNFRVLYDADLLVNLLEKDVTRGRYLTKTGREIALRLGRSQMLT